MAQSCWFARVTEPRRDVKVTFGTNRAAHVGQCAGSCLSGDTRLALLAFVCKGCHRLLGVPTVVQLHLLSHNLLPASSARLCTNITLPCNNLQLGAREEERGWGTSSSLSSLCKYGTKAWQAQPKGILRAASRAAAGQLLMLWRVFLWKWGCCAGWGLWHVQGQRRLTAPWLATASRKVNGGACAWSTHF